METKIFDAAVQAEREKLQEFLSDDKTPLAPLLPYEVAAKLSAFDASSFEITDFLRRKKHIAEHGFVYLTQECSDVLSALFEGRRCLDAGSGTGWLSHHLASRGVDITAVDKGGEDFSRHGQVRIWKRDQEGDALQYLDESVDAVLLCWPHPSTNMATRISRAMRSGQILVYQGESAGGCTAEYEFFTETQDLSRWELLAEPTDALNAVHLQFAGMHDDWTVLRKL